MTPKQHKTRDVSRDHYTTYRKKAKEFLNSMEASLRVREWNAAGLNAVHCAISSADALLVYHAGIRSAGDSHHDISFLLVQHVKDADTAPKAKTLSKIIDYKYLAAYEDREIIESEALELAKITRRFFDWMESLLS
ncbi:MAG: hypothetical protein A2234_05985 [Elusimicrobia bacterium RIFOXYA2_FULL_58_8]|nr:MAG: hypothetical protein A2285_06570 [Elusimicrobia bacterium RIFOXYA12_FULL_57_11]OGS12826.1 MAG: hypothetical protein A2234_05985 [Elusimicrobia bacterium RIFOXYA2_FULL_58_8]